MISSLENKFFVTHRSDDIVENALVNFIRKQNDNKHFVEQVARQIGFPRWNKAFYTSIKTASAFNSTSEADSAKTFFIPFVRDSQEYVNAVLVIKTLSRDTSFGYKCDWQYHSLQNSRSSVADSAEHFAVFFMTMDNIVFGHKSFLITDKALFETPNYTPLTVSFEEDNPQNLYAVSHCETVRICSNGISTLNVTMPMPCELSITYNYCWSDWIDTDFESGGSPGPGGSGGGGSGGGSVPPQCDSLRASLVNVVIDPCEPGWVPDDGGSEAPCDPIISALASNQVFKNKFSNLNTNVPNPDNYETIEFIYDLNDASQYVHAQGTSQSPSIPFTGLGNNHKAIIHRHYDGLNDMFSTGDVWNMMVLQVNLTSNRNEYFWGMVGPYEIPYIIKVKDPAKLSAFIHSTDFDAFDEKYKGTFNYSGISGNNINNKQNEIGLLKMLRRENLDEAIELYRGNNNFTEWAKLNTNGRAVFEKPCN